MRLIGKPRIRKLGTLDRDMVETTPLVIGGRLYRFEYVRENYWKNPSGTSYFQFRDVETNALTAPFAHGHHLGSAYAEDGCVYAFGVTKWGCDTMRAFRSTDLVHWEEKTIFTLPGWELYNSSVCRGADGYVMAFEIGGPPEECGHPFTIRFAVSPNVWDWSITPSECVYSKDRYTACPVIRYLPKDGYYYMIYLEALPGWGFASYIARSADLVAWRRSPVNPVMMYDDEDKLPYSSTTFSVAERERIAGALNCNNSDVDLCEFLGRTVINYGWGNQTGVEFLAEAVYDGPLDEFLQGFFQEWEGGEPC